MKKKTVITTEKHEVWVIRPPGEGFGEESSVRQKSEGTESLSQLPEYDPDKDEPDCQENQ